MSAETTVLQAGRELDAIIAARVFGYRVAAWSIHLINSPDDVRDREWRHGMFSGQAFYEGRFPVEVLVADDNGDMPGVLMLVAGEWMGIPRYSSEIAGAWQVVERMRALGWTMEFNNQDIAHAFFWQRYLRSEGTGRANRSPPLAICRAALQAVQP